MHKLIAAVAMFGASLLALHPFSPTLTAAEQPISDRIVSTRPHTKLATFGMGCFWRAEADFCAIRGVHSTRVGYAGGRTGNPSYRSVSSGRTGHAEVVQVEYDPAVISYPELLEVFWRGHDPTTRNRQGVDVGPQYRSLILFHSLKQQAAAKASREELSRSNRFHSPLVTEIQPLKGFHPAEEYHQRYLQKHGRARCRN